MFSFLFHSWDFVHFHRSHAPINFKYQQNSAPISIVQLTKYAENGLFMPWQNSGRLLCWCWHTMPNVSHLRENRRSWGRLRISTICGFFFFCQNYDVNRSTRISIEASLMDLVQDYYLFFHYFFFNFCSFFLLNDCCIINTRDKRFRNRKSIRLTHVFLECFIFNGNYSFNSSKSEFSLHSSYMNFHFYYISLFFLYWNFILKSIANKSQLKIQKKIPARGLKRG